MSRIQIKLLLVVLAVFSHIPKTEAVTLYETVEEDRISEKEARHVDPDSNPEDGNLTELVGTDFEVAPKPPLIPLSALDEHEHLPESIPEPGVVENEGIDTNQQFGAPDVHGHVSVFESHNAPEPPQEETSPPEPEGEPVGEPVETLPSVDSSDFVPPNQESPPPDMPEPQVNSKPNSQVEFAESESKSNKVTGLLNNPNKFDVTTTVLEASADEDSSACSERRGALMPIRPNSKFLVDSHNRYTREQARKLCMNSYLVMADLDGLADHVSLQSFIDKYKSSKLFNKDEDRFYIGPSDIRREGVYLRGDGKKLKFQNYHLSQPDDKTLEEDCTTISKEKRDGPIGSNDEECNKRYHVVCMFKPNSKCYEESYETLENKAMDKKPGLTLLVNASERAYFVSTFQQTWKDSMDYCQNQSMQLFNMDHVVNMAFFRTLLKWESTFIHGPFPTVEYWTSGKFKKTHMKAEVYWKKSSNLTDSEERYSQNFTFSGVFKWSTKKKLDPGGPIMYRRDTCLSFGFDSKPDGSPYVRNTNCDIPYYFVCYEEYGEGSSAN